MMLRAVLTALAALPLLMPEGMCICRLLPSVAGSPVQASTAPVASSARERPSGCKCKKHCRAKEATARPASASAATDPCRCFACPEKKQNGPGSRDGHLPCCPGLHSMPVVPPAVESSGAGQGDLAPVFGHAPLVMAPTVPDREPPRVSACAPSAPLFLSHCALVI